MAFYKLLDFTLVFYVSILNKFICVRFKITLLFKKRNYIIIPPIQLI
jgi:hypothetical protein